MNTFESLDLSKELKNAIKELGFSQPTPIQEKTIPALLESNSDFLGVAATGTGKTAAFLIPALAKMDRKHMGPQYLIVCPTRELAKQISQSLHGLSKYQGVRQAVIYGGAGYDSQFEALDKNPQFVVATPGRLLDHLKRGSIRLDDIKVLILDEADEMISLGFKEEVEEILSSVRDSGARPNTWFFTATMRGDVSRIAEKFLYEPIKVELNKDSAASSNVEQNYYLIREKDKAEVITRIIDEAEDFYGMIFCQTKKAVEELAMYLTKNKYPAMELHGDKTQREREYTMQRFRDKDCRILVCTDVAARGIDVKNLTHVVNHTLPREIDSYVHRIGRTGRQGETGKSITLVTPDRMGLIRRLEAVTKSKILKAEVPSAKAVVERKLGKMIESILKVSQEQIDLLSAEGIQNRLKVFEGMDTLEIAKRFCAYFDKDLIRNLKNDDLNLDASASQGRFSRDRGEGRGDRRSDSGSRSRGRSGRGGRSNNRFGDRDRERSFDRGDRNSDRGSRPPRGNNRDRRGSFGKSNRDSSVEIFH